MTKNYKADTQPSTDLISFVNIVDAKLTQTPPHATASVDNLLSALWRTPSKCHQFGVLNPLTGAFQNKPVASAREAVKRASEFSKNGRDTFFACAEYANSGCRKAENASSATGFWMDIDCGETKVAKGAGYPTSNDALHALQSFCKDTGLPLPTHIVASGGGLHIYWVLDSQICRETWQLIAEKLKALTKALEFLADHCRTADIASVLRVPGTLNFKYNPPRPVVLLYSAAAFIERPVMLDAIVAAHARFCRIKNPHHSSAVANDTPLRAKCHTEITGPVVANCKMLRLLQVILAHLNADCGYDDWFRIAAAVFHETGGSEDGFCLFDSWSSTSDKYRGVQETKSKWKSLRPDHPTPVTMATLRRMVEANGYDWLDVCAAAEDGFDNINAGVCGAA